MRKTLMLAAACSIALVAPTTAQAGPTSEAIYLAADGVTVNPQLHTLGGPAVGIGGFIFPAAATRPIKVMVEDLVSEAVWVFICQNPGGADDPSDVECGGPGEPAVGPTCAAAGQAVSLTNDFSRNHSTSVFVGMALSVADCGSPGSAGTITVEYN